MGFFSKASSLLGGGSSSKTSSQSGFSLLPSQIQQSYTGFADILNGLLGNNAANIEAFTPMGITGDEEEAFNRIRQGFTPTQDTIISDVQMQTNPFEASVLDEINRQAGGEYSLLKQAQSEAGQLGSNRQILGANDIDQRRINQIGAFRYGNFQNALNNALTTLPQSRASDAAGLLDIGSFERGLDSATRQAPYSSLAYLAQILGVLPTDGGSKSNSSTESQNGLFGGGGGGPLANVGKMFSDRRLKENIIQIGVENGHNVYRFNYKEDPTEYIGVMADEVREIRPQAVGTADNGYDFVNYDAIGVEFRRA